MRVRNAIATALVAVGVIYGQSAVLAIQNMLLMGAGTAAYAQSAPADATYITQTANGTLSAEQALGSLTTGLLKSTTTTGVISIGVAGTDFAAAANGYRNKVTLGGDQTDSSGANTYADCTGLSFAVTSGTRYNFTTTIWYTSAATTTGSGWSINGPATTNMTYMARSTLAAGTQTIRTETAYNQPTTSGATSLTAGNIAVIDGTILPSANGSVIVRFMTEVDTSAVVCKAGSTLEWWIP